MRGLRGGSWCISDRPSRPYLPLRSPGRGLGLGSARSNARDARRVEPKPRWEFPLLRAATVRRPASAHRTVYLRHCRAPRRPCQGLKDWFCSSCLLSLIHRHFNFRAPHGCLLTQEFMYPLGYAGASSDRPGRPSCVTKDHVPSFLRC